MESGDMSVDTVMVNELESFAQSDRRSAPPPSPKGGRKPIRRKRGRSATPSVGTKRPRTKPKVANLNPLPLPLAPPCHPGASPHAKGRSLLVWGNGDMGQHGLALDMLEEIQRPRIHTWAEEATNEGILGPHGLDQVVTGGMHTIALDSNGRIWSWGINDNAALGRSTTRDPDREPEELETVPTPVEGLSPTGEAVIGGEGSKAGTVGSVETFRATRVAASGSCSLALDDQGRLRVWGSFRSNEGLLGFDPSPRAARLQYTPRSLHGLERVQFSALACGEDHVLALSLQGQVWAWGNGQQCQLGRKVIERRKLNALLPSRLALQNIVSIGCGAYHSFAINRAGIVYAWGLNTFGQLGLETVEDQVVEPQVVEALLPSRLDGAKVIQIDAGAHFSLFLLDNGQVWGTGRCDGNELGLAEDHPAKLTLAEARRVWEAEREVQLQEETLVYEKRMAQRKLDDVAGVFVDMLSSQDMPPTRGPPPDEYVTDPVHIPLPNEPFIIQVSAGPRYSLAVARDGHAYSWGLGQASELGQGDEETVETPRVLRSAALRTQVSLTVSAGGQHAAMLGMTRAEETRI